MSHSVNITWQYLALFRVKYLHLYILPQILPHMWTRAPFKTRAQIHESTIKIMMSKKYLIKCLTRQEILPGKIPMNALSCILALINPKIKFENSYDLRHGKENIAYTVMYPEVVAEYYFWGG